MTKYTAKNDTVWNFKFYRKGETLDTNINLDDNTNFIREGAAPAETPATKASGNGKKVVSEQEQALRLRGKELKIANWHILSPENLAAEIAKKEAELAQPAVNEQPAETPATETSNN